MSTCFELVAKLIITTLNAIVIKAIIATKQINPFFFKPLIVFYLKTFLILINNITIQIAERLVDIFYIAYKIKLDIKEPNDLYYNNKKIGGILTESKIFKNKVKYLVVGIGINTSQTKFHKEIDNIASSIKNEFNIDISVEKIITEFCNCFEKEFEGRIRK